MTRLAAFFKEPYTSMGAFYPMHHIVAVFDDLPTAEKYARELRNAGLPADAVLAAEGEEFLRLEKEAVDGLVNSVARSLSRGFGTEQLETDHNEQFALDGKAFLFVHCPTNHVKEKAWKLLKTDDLISAHYYTRIAVEHMACHFSTT